MSNITPTDRVEFHCKRNGYPMPVREFQFAAPVRAWAFDLAWPALRIAVEIDGGMFGIGKPCEKCGRRDVAGHSSIQRLKGDQDKLNEAVCRGWRVFRLRPDQLASMSGEGLNLLDRVLVKGGS